MGTPRGETIPRQYLVLELAQHRCALPIDLVEAIRSVPPLDRHGAGSPRAGTMTVGGRPVPVVDLRALVGLPGWKPRRDASVVLAGRGSRRCGLLVDMVVELTDLRDGEIGEGGGAGMHPRYVCGVASRRAPITVLDSGAILDACEALP